MRIGKFARDKSVLAGILAGIYAFATFSGIHRKNKWEKFTGWDYAHRGLHDSDAGIPENSMPAFERAVRHGYGIELDVRMTRDGYLVIMHDDSLLRMCGLDRRVSQMTLKELQPLYLLHTDEKIPLFSDVLKLVDGRVPLLVEINACIWQAIGEFYDADVSVETEVAFNQVRCKLSELQSTKDVAEMLATA